MKYKSILLVAVLSAVTCISGCTRNQLKDYVIGVPVENCSKVSYDNYHLTDNGVNIYCPSGSLVVAAMDGIVDNMSKDSMGWVIQTINPSYQFTSQYSYLDSPLVHIRDTLSIYDTIGVTAYQTRYLRFVLYQLSNKDTIYLNPLPKFNDWFQ